MNCDQCDNEATVFLTEFANGKVRKVNLCEQCATEHQGGAEDPAGLELSDLLWGLGNPDQKVSMEDEVEEQELLCLHCGFTESDFDKTERLGCPQCYGVYAERLSGMWKNFQNGSVHTGKRPRNAEAIAAPTPVPTPSEVPASAPVAKEQPARKKKPLPEWEDASDGGPKAAIKQFEEKIADLQAQMAEALREEAYEQAAVLRDSVREFEQMIRDFETHDQKRLSGTGDAATVGSSSPGSSTSESA